MYIKEKLRNGPNTLKFKEIMTSKNKYDLQKLCWFVAIINKGVYPPNQIKLNELKINDNRIQRSWTKWNCHTANI